MNSLIQTELCYCHYLVMFISLKRLGKRMLKRGIQLIIILFAFITFGSEGNAQILSDQSLQLHIEGEKIKANNFSTVISKISSIYKVPIGFEPESKIEAQNTQESTQAQFDDNASLILVNDGSLREVLDELVKFKPQYNWEVLNGVINIYPKLNRDIALQAILETRIDTFSFENINSIMSLGSRITDAEEVKSTIKSFGLESIHFFTSDELSKTKNGAVVTNYHFSKPIKKTTDTTLTYQFHNLTVREVLNNVVRVNSSRKFWTIIKWGESNDIVTIITK